MDQLSSLSFTDPREPLLTLLPRCTALTKLVLVDFTTVTERGWHALAECSKTLRVLKLEETPFVTDEQMALVLANATKLEKLALRNLVGVRGECLQRSNFAVLRDLRLASCCANDVALRDAVARAPLLERLWLLGGTGWSADLFKTIACVCRRLRCLAVACGHREEVLAGAYWLARVISLQQLRVIFPAQFADTLAPLMRYPQLHALEFHAVSSKVVPVLTRALANMPSLADLQVPQCLMADEDVAAVLGAGLPLATLLLTISGTPTRALDLLRQCRALCSCALTNARYEMIATPQYPPPTRRKVLNAFEQLNTPAGMRQTCRAVANFIAPLSQRTKYAFLVFFGDAWSFQLLMLLLNRGYQVVCGVVMSAFDESAREQFPVLRDEGLFEGVFWVTMDLNDPLQLKRDVAAITPHLHCIIPIYPLSRSCTPVAGAPSPFKAVQYGFGDSASLKEGEGRCHAKWKSFRSSD